MHGRTYIPDGLVGKWMVGDGHPNAQRGTIVDLSGRSHPGTIYGVPALYFDSSGSDKYVSPGSVFEWMGDGAHPYVALRFAVKPSATGSDQTIYEEVGGGGPMLLVATDDSGDIDVSADTDGGGSGNLRTVNVASVLTMDAWNYVLLVIDAVNATFYAWVNGTVATTAQNFSGAFDHTAFQTGTPASQRWGLTSAPGNPLDGYLACMGVGGLDSLPTLADAQAIYDNPQGSLSGGSITWDAWYRCNENANPADNGEGTAARDLTTTTAAWDVGANLGNAWVNSSGAGDSFNAGSRYLDKTDDYIVVASHADFQAAQTTPVGIHFWFIDDDATGDHTVLMNLGDHTNDGFMIRIVSGTYIQMSGNAGYDMRSQTAVRDGALHFVTVAFNPVGGAGSGKIYLDGADDTNPSYTWSNHAWTTGENLSIGAYLFGGAASFFDGRLFQVLWQNGATSESGWLAKMLLTHKALCEQGPYR